MAKNKKRQLEKKRRIIETRKKQKIDIKDNPFEIQHNRIKHHAIGRRIAKNEIGKPGFSRNRAMELRKGTLLSEYMRRNKSGKSGIKDRRFKEEDGGATARKTKIFKPDNLNEEQVILTHKGKLLGQFEDDRISSDEDDDVNLFERSEFIESAHFGGGTDGKPKSANEVLDEIMNEKRERQAEKEKNIELTKRLDEDWSSVANLVRHSGVNDTEIDNEKSDYDILVRQLMFDVKNNCDQKSTVNNNMKDIISSINERINEEEQEKLKTTDEMSNEDTNDTNNSESSLIRNKTNETKLKPKLIRPLPFMLPMLEPKYGCSGKSGSERKKLVKKYKREFKGAQRELRKDAIFMRNVILNDTIEKDRQRKQKVKELFGELASERQQYKKLKK